MNLLPLQIGLRYLRAKRRNGFVSFISAVSMLGLTLGVMLLIIVLSVMNGFERELRTRILSVVPHGVVQSDEPLENWQALVPVLEAHPEVQGVMPFIEGQALLTGSGNPRPAMVKGIEPDSLVRTSILEEHMTQGSLHDLQPGEWGVVMGDLLANRLGLRLGDRVTLMIPEVSLSIAGAHPRLRQFTLVGTFELGAEIDANLALVHYQQLARLQRMPTDSIQGFELRVNDLFQAPRITREVARELYLTTMEQDPGRRWFANDWTITQGTLFQAIALEKRMVSLLLTAVIAVAAFNIISSLVMMVTDKQGDIAILRTMGASRAQVMVVFLVQGTAIGVIGVLLGVGLGIIGALTIDSIVASIEQLLGQQVLNSDIYFINYLPSDLRWPDVVRVALISFSIAVLATLYPAWRAAQVLPSEALRYE